jgi:hypothetical protein
VSACVPGGRPAGSDQDTHASISRVDTGTAQCSEEADHTHDDLELPSAEAVLEIVLLPVDDIPSERRALRQSSRNRAKAFLEAIGQMARPPRPGAVTSAVACLAARPGLAREEPLQATGGHDSGVPQDRTVEGGREVVADGLGLPGTAS